jgi:prevent-host-death family protein
MSEVSSTDAARNFADLLDAVEHRGERFTIVRRGRAIAQLEPVRGGTGAAAKKVLRRHGQDPSWAEDLASLRQLIEVEERS